MKCEECKCRTKGRHKQWCMSKEAIAIKLRLIEENKPAMVIFKEKHEVER